MKLVQRALLVLVVAAFVAQTGGAASARARIRTTADSAAFWTPRVGLLGFGRCTSSAWQCGTGSVELTSDGGRTYRVVFRTARPVVAIRTAGPRGAFAVTADDRVFRTLDRGRTWARWHTRLSASFATPEIGLSSRSGLERYTRRVLFRTTDGGRRWRPLRPPSTLCLRVALVDLVTPRLAWMVCAEEPGAGDQGKAAFRSRDGGRTWRMGAAATENITRGGIGIGGYPSGIAFSTNGFGIMWESRGQVTITRDGGTTWHAEPFPVSGANAASGAAAFSDGTGFVLIDEPVPSMSRPSRLMKTVDFGRTWRVVRRWRG